MKMRKIKNIGLAEQGFENIALAEKEMKVMALLKNLYKNYKFLKGYKIAGAIHVTKETAVLIRTLRYFGADVAWAGCNPLSTQDDIAAALYKEGVDIFAWRGVSQEEYYWCIDEIIKTKPNLTMDDGCDVVVRLHEKFPENLEYIIGGTEETTTGVHRLKSMNKAGKLKYPIMAVNDAQTKWDFDNVYGTGQGTIDGILRAYPILLNGKNFVVAGYGHCGRGVAMIAKGHKANVIITEVNPVKALEAKMEGYEVMPMNYAAKIGDIFVTATGCKDVITEKHFKMLKDGAVLCNTGHFNCEVDAVGLEKYSISKKQVRPNNARYDFKDGRSVYLLAEGRLVNLSAAEGHPSAVMDLSFANQILALKYIVENKEKLNANVYEISKEQDNFIAMLKLKSLGIGIDKLTAEQIKYLESYNEGT